jgi:hypothetical protein
MQSPVLKGHLFLVVSYKISYELNLFLEVTCLIRPLFFVLKVTSKYKFDYFQTGFDINCSIEICDFTHNNFV